MMDGRQLRDKLVGSDDERAVSPVIGVILMVAITVILAAVIAAFVMDIGPGSDTTPNAQMDVEYDNSPTDSELTFVHNGGDSFEVDDVVINIQGESQSAPFDDTDADPGETVSVGDAPTLTLDGANNFDDLSGPYTVQLIHEPSDGVIVSSTIEFDET